MTVIPYLIALPLIGHGLVHLSGVFAPWMRNLQGYTDTAWIFSSRITLTSVLGKGYSLVWLAASACLLLAGAGSLFRQRYWIPAAVAGSLLSLAAILPWWKAVPPGAKVGALFDLITLALLFSPCREKISQLLAFSR